MKIGIDPGHGMANRKAGVFDPGAVHTPSHPPLFEADVVLEYGLALKERLRSGGFEVFITRQDSQTPTPLSQRAQRVKEAGGDILISLHLNASDDPAAQGVEVIYNRDNSKPLARLIQERLVRTTHFRDRGIKHRPELAVLKFTGPAVLIELGFISNEHDRNTLLEAEVREAINDAIVDALDEFIQSRQAIPAHMA